MSWIPVMAAAAAEARWSSEALRVPPEGPGEMRAVPAYPRLTLKRPVFLERQPGSDRILVIENYAWEEYRSVIRRFVDEPAVSEAETVLEIPGAGELAYGLCFHPRFAENGHLYIGTNGRGPGEAHHSRIVRYTMSRQAPWQIDPASRRVIIEWPSNGHNGAAAVFGNDGMLYVTSGDGSPNSDALNAGQQTDALLAKVLRIDVDGATQGEAYRVPADNPFVGKDGIRPETWAYGLRNPWRITNDPVSGQIWVGQNGQDLREYAHLLERGANYGWSEFEGSRLFQPGKLRGPAAFTAPTIEHDHAAFRSLTGGFVYRGSRFPALQGAYLYGDYGTGRVWAARHDGSKLLWKRELADSAAAIAGFGTNAAGDILLADHLGNTVLRLEPARPVAADAPVFPRKLSETGLFRDLSRLEPAPGVFRYRINAPSWHDGAESEFLIALPEGKSAEMPGDPAGAWKSWNLPDGAVLVQTLAVPAGGDRPAVRAETRILVRSEADWFAYTWLWNKEQSEADLVGHDGMKTEIAGNPWEVPARTACTLCHARGANYVLGLTTAQLSPDGSEAGSLGELRRAGIIRKPAASAGGWPVLVNPGDATKPLARRVHAYLSVNCSHCHRHEGGGNSLMDLSPWMQGAARHLINAAPQHGGYGMPDARLIAPGEVHRSVLPVRMSSRGPGQMPPVGSIHPDAAGLSLLYQWLQSGAGESE
jgi:glucose/arabinose dehydrogenase